MFGSKKVPVCSDDSALVNSHHMMLWDICILNVLHSHDDHPMDVVFELKDHTKKTEHTLMINSNHVIEALHGLTDDCVESLEEKELIRKSLRLLTERSRQYSKDCALRTN